MQDLRMLIGGVVMLFISAFLMAEHSQATTAAAPVQTFSQMQHAGLPQIH